jgi:hypothetical protein
MSEDRDELVATFTLTRRASGQLELRVQTADGKWKASSLERHTSMGWHEAVEVWAQMRTLVEGSGGFPW